MKSVKTYLIKIIEDLCAPKIQYPIRLHDRMYFSLNEISPFYSLIVNIFETYLGLVMYTEMVFIFNFWFGSKSGSMRARVCVCVSH